MVRKVEIKDKDKQIECALKAAGFNTNQVQVEIILNIIDYIRENNDKTTLLDIIQIKDMVNSLYKE